MKQSKEFYKALKEKDGAKAHQLFIRPVETKLSEHINRIVLLRQKHEAEMDYINGIPEEFMGFEIKYQIKKRNQK